MLATVSKRFASHHYGFAKPDVPGPDIFLHVSAFADVSDERLIAIEKRIVCELSADPEGKRPRGVQVRLVQPASIGDRSQRSKRRTKYDRLKERLS